MTSLPRFSVGNPVLINIMMITMFVGGAYSGLTLVREMFPETQPNRVLITTAYPGASPVEVEKGITRKIEEQVKDILGVEDVLSTVTEGSSLIVVELRSGYDEIDQAVDDIKAAVDAIPREDFPEEALETQVTKFTPRFPVINVSLFGDADDRTLKEMGEQLRDDILMLPGITEVVLSGTRKDEISVEVNPDKLVEYGVSFMQVGQIIADTNLDLPGGRLKTPGADVAVRTLGQKDWGDELYDIIILSDPDGSVVRLSDIATIVDAFEDVDVAGRFHGQPAVTITVYKTSDQDAVRIASLVKAMEAGLAGKPLQRSWTQRLLARFAARDEVRETYQRAANNPYPAGLHIQSHTDLSRFIKSRLDLLMRNGFYGLMLVFLSLLMLLHWRVALWVMMGLLLAICGSIICMKALGLTLNLISMLGLIIVLGLLVDDAIIVAENVYSKVEQGMDPKLAAIAGSEEVIWPVTAAIVTTIVAFLPLMGIEGQMGDWMGVLPIIVCVALTVSLFEALTILPSHLAHGIRPVSQTDETHEGKRLGAVGRFSYRIRKAQDFVLHQTLMVAYDRLLRVSTRNRYVTMACLVSGMFVVVGMYRGDLVSYVFLPEMDSETLVANLKMSVGTPIDETSAALERIERAAMELPDEELASLYTLVGAIVDESLMRPSQQAHTAQAIIELREIDKRERSSDQIMQELREKTADIPGVDQLVYESRQGGPGGAAIQLDISGERMEDLNAVAEHFKQRLSLFEGVYDITDDFDAGRPEVQIELNESARLLGLTTESLATQVRSAFYGFEARKIQRGREDVKIMVRYPPEHRRQIYDIESMYIATPGGAMVPFTEVARLREGTGFATIKRKNHLRTVSVRADVDDDITNSDKVIAELTVDFPEINRQYPAVALEFAGMKLETKRAFGSIRRGFVAACLMIYAILAGLFKSYFQPLIIMAAIPFGLIGAVVGHFVMGYQLTILSMIGLVALTGIVANDSLILVVFINKRIADGTAAYDAVIEASRSRLRPILLTSVTTVLGLAPLLAETSFQARFLIPMGISISAGLIFATVLTLLAVPALYLIYLDAQLALRGLYAWLLGREMVTE